MRGTNMIPVGPDGAPAPLESFGELRGDQGLSGGPIASMILGMIRDPRTGQLRKTDFFVYSFNLLPVPANGDLAQSVTVQADSDFLAVAATGSVRDTGTAAAVAATHTVRVTSSGSGRDLFDRPQDWDNIIGDAQNPAWWPVPYFVPRASSLEAVVADLGGTDRNVRISLWGIKIFDSTMGQ